MCLRWGLCVLSCACACEHFAREQDVRVVRTGFANGSL